MKNTYFISFSFLIYNYRCGVIVYRCMLFRQVHFEIPLSILPDCRFFNTNCFAVYLTFYNFAHQLSKKRRCCMKGVLLIFMISCFAFLGMQDMVNLKMVEAQTMLLRSESVTPADCQAESWLARQSSQQTYFYNGNSGYVQLLYRISQGNEDVQLSTEQIRLFHKFISGSYLKSFNNKQRASELASSSATIAHSALHYRFAHLIFLLRKIVI